jgi:hypothetical protein
LWGSAGAERGRETFLRSSGRRKALKGEAQERWELKEALEGAKAQSAERVAKPCGRRLRETGHVSRTPHQTVGRTKGRSLPVYAEGPRSFSEALFGTCLYPACRFEAGRRLVGGQDAEVAVKCTRVASHSVAGVKHLRGAENPRVRGCKDERGEAKPIRPLGPGETSEARTNHVGGEPILATGPGSPLTQA